jgi:hypothetical protein
MGAHDKEELSRVNKKISQFQIILNENAITETAIKFIPGSSAKSQSCFG